MCILFIAKNIFPNFPLLLVANRDEFHSRPTLPLHFWEDHPEILAGRDEKEGGTWMGVSKTGRISALTNHRNIPLHRSDARSRGFLVKNFLSSSNSPEDYLQELIQTRKDYNPYNLVFGDKEKLFVYSNISNDVNIIETGIFGLSNAFLDTPWPKIERGKKAIQKLSESFVGEVDKLFQIMRNEEKADDRELPDTGIGLAKERLLSSIFIQDSIYGTRSTAILLVPQIGSWTFYERSFNNAGEILGERFDTLRY